MSPTTRLVIGFIGLAAIACAILVVGLGLYAILDVLGAAVHLLQGAL